MKTYRLAPSLLSADFTELGSQIDLLKSLGVRALHCDIMDGDFVPSISFGMPVLKSIRKRTDLYLDAHLMVTEPDRYIDAFVVSGRGRHTVPRRRPVGIWIARCSTSRPAARRRRSL